MPFPIPNPDHTPHRAKKLPRINIWQDQYIGDRLIELRSWLAIDRVALARRAGVNRSALWDIEHNKRRPRWATIRSLAKGLHSIGKYTIVPKDLLGKPGTPLILDRTPAFITDQEYEILAENNVTVESDTIIPK